MAGESKSAGGLAGKGEGSLEKPILRAPASIPLSTAEECINVISHYSGYAIMNDGEHPRARKPEKPSGWNSAYDLVEEQGYEGPVKRVEARLEELQRDLIGDMQNAGYSEAQAEAYVNNYLVRSREGHGKIVSADGQHLLAIRRRDEEIPCLKEGWKSEFQISKELEHKRHLVQREMWHLQEKLEREFREAGYEPSGAHHFVEQNYIRRERPGSGGMRIWVASPAACAMLGCVAVALHGQDHLVLAETIANDVLGSLIKSMVAIGCSEQGAVEMIGRHVEERMRIASNVPMPSPNSDVRTWQEHLCRDSNPEPGHDLS